MNSFLDRREVSPCKSSADVAKRRYVLVLSYDARHLSEFDFAVLAAVTQQQYVLIDCHIRQKLF